MSLSQNELDQVRKLAEEVSTREGCKLYDVEFGSGGGHRILRVFIDKLTGAGEGSGGASLEDCVNVSRGLNLMLDVEDPIPGGRYELEVSTPGVERKLTQLWHYEQAKGETVRVRFRNEEGLPETWEAAIKDVAGTKVTIEGKKGTLDIDFSQIENAKKVFAGPAKGQKR